MKKLTLKLATLTMVLCVGGVFGTAFGATYHNRHDNPKPLPAEPPTVTDVDTTAMTVTVKTGKSSPDVYKLTKITTILIDGKSGTIDKIEKGMKASVTGSPSNLSKIELTSGGSGTEEAKPKKSNKKN